MKVESEINRHTEIEKTCPQCGIRYLVQGGGQKSGTSPAVHVGKDGRAVGYCSSRCMAEKIENTLVYKTFLSWGLNHDEIFPSGYLAPANRIKATPTPSPREV